jgi:hypothetical protein
VSAAMARRASSARAALGRLFRWHSQGMSVGVEVPGAESDLADLPSSDRLRPTEQEPVASARGVIRRQVVPLLSQYGTSYGLFDA